MDSTDWRTTLLPPESRQRIINKIMETLKRHLPISGPEGLVQLSKIATTFEEKIYTAATSQSDYLRKISMKMMTMETKSQTTGMANTIQSNSAGSAQNPPDSGQSQIPLSNQSETWNQMFSQNANTRVQSSANLPSVTSPTHTTTADASAQSTNMQSGIEQNSVRSSVSQGLPSNIFSNSQYLNQHHQMLSYSTTQPGQDAIDWRWRSTLPPDCRQKQLNRILETLKNCFPICGSVGLVELNNIAGLFEEEIYTAATSHSDYLRKIYMKMIVMESESQTTGKGRKANTIQSNSAGSAQNPPDSGQSQIPLSNKFEAWQQLLSQNVENTIANTGVQSSSNLPSALPSVTSLTHTSTANAAGQSTNMQSVIEQNFVRNSVSQGLLPSNIFSNSQYLYQQQQLQLQMLSYSTTQTGQDAIDWSWRIALRPDSRQKQLNRILETLKNCFPICGSVGLVELNKIAELFEEEIYTAAKSHLDYLQKVYLKILKMETRFQTAASPQYAIPSAQPRAVSDSIA